jgi:hypothetical protein
LIHWWRYGTSKTDDECASHNALRFWLWLQPNRWEDEMIQDLRYGVRMLLKNPGFTIVAVLTLALGIGANTALFSLIEGTLLRPLPYAASERLTVLWTTKVDKGETQLPVSYPDWLSWSEQQRVFEGIGIFRNRPAFLQGRDEPWRAEYFETSANFFSLLNVPAAVGAGRMRLIRQLLAENLVLAALGGALGLALAFWTVSLLRPLALAEIPRLETLQINLKVLGFAAALSLLTGVIFGLAPALQASRVGLDEALKGGRQLTAGRSSNRLRYTLMAVEVALSLVLLVGAGLLLQTFWRSQSAHGLDAPEKILTLQFTLAQSKYNQSPQNLAFYHELLERLRRIPGVQTAGLTTSLLQIGDPSGTEFEVEGRAPLAQEEKPIAGYTMVNSEYFSLAGIKLRAGRRARFWMKQRSSPVRACCC